jgi:protein-tyrosine-phosphatase/DNA-binding transcriptional ArsR family regulator
MDVERLARLHAALGDPARLRIVDALALGDAGPGELAVRFGLATNLLAFHLRVLEDAGIVRRVRSEGDRRRQYVQLRLDDPEVARLTRSPGARRPGPPPRRLVFVCSANSARSQLAAAVWRRRSRVPATSAGTRPADRVHPLAAATARGHGLDLGAAVPRGLDAVTGRPEATVIVAVCDNAHEELARLHHDEQAPGALQDLVAHPWLHWHVPDPAPAGTRAAFESAYGEIVQRVDRLAAGLGVST